MGLEVLSGLNQRFERVSIPTLYFFQERTYLKHQTGYPLFLVKTNYPTLLQTSRPTVLGLGPVKAHDILAFAASKVFYGGLLVDQIMQAYYHWKVHNTFTNFYLKGLTWSENKNNMYLGPVVTAQQVLDPSLQTSHPRRKRRGHTCCSQVFRSLNPRV